jgi:hypothetical protein
MMNAGFALRLKAPSTSEFGVGLILPASSDDDERLAYAALTANRRKLLPDSVFHLALPRLWRHATAHVAQRH